MLTAFWHAYINGVFSSMIQSAAHFNCGHVRVMTTAYAEESSQIPNDLALLGIDTLLSDLKQRYQDLLWTPRIKFGGLLDIPDEQGETRTQAPIFGMGLNLLSSESPERGILNVQNSVVKGQMPQNRGEILIADELAEKLGVEPGGTATLISSTMFGSMAVANFTVAGTVRFGVAAMDRGTMVADLSDIQQALDMTQGAGEILGFFRDDVYHEDWASSVAADFNARTNRPQDPFSAIMGTLRMESGLADYLDLAGMIAGAIIGIFVFAMSIVLWNTGLTGGLRRYGEVGVRLAIGEDKGHVYRSMLAESFMIGFAGSLLGTGLGLACAYYLQVHGINIGWMMKGSTMILNDVIRAQVTVSTAVIGFVPGLLAPFLGTAISGIGIYKRQTSQLFKEHET